MGPRSLPGAAGHLRGVDRLPAAEGRRQAILLAGPGNGPAGRPAQAQAPRPPGPAAKGAGIRSPRPAGCPRRPASRCPARVSGGSLYRAMACPAIFGTYLRPDSVHTSYVAGIVSMNQRLLRFELRPGAEDPGPGSYGGRAARDPARRPPRPGRDLQRRLQDRLGGGGFYLNGTYRGALRPGAASMVYYRDGHLAIGTWGHGLGMTPQRDRRPAEPAAHRAGRPGSRLGGQNVRATGAPPWAAAITSGGQASGSPATAGSCSSTGPPSIVRTLAGLLRRAGCVEAMQLDINPDWTNFMYYRPGVIIRPIPAPVSLLPDQVQPAGRYYRRPTGTSPRSSPGDPAPVGPARARRPARRPMLAARGRHGGWRCRVTARPRQWPKNLLVLAAPLAARRWAATTARAMRCSRWPRSPRPRARCTSSTTSSMRTATGVTR